MISIATGGAPGRVLGAATAMMGGAFLLRPRALADRFSGGRSTPDDAIVRVLGGRQLVQGVAQIARPVPSVVLGGIVVDLIHTASMLVLSALWPTYRRSAFSSAAIASLFAAAGTAVLINDRQ